MRFSRIELPAYGSFTEFAVFFSKRGGDFQIIHGPNEAGKSTLLRAIRGLLYGIPIRSPDVFLHPPASLRILAEIEDHTGELHCFQRRKGRDNTLLDAEGNAINDSRLSTLLGAVDETYFESLFGLGSEELRKGATDLLQGKGRLGEALFSASMGGTPVEKVIAGLEKEADELFSGRANRRIRQSMRAREEHLKQAKDAFIKPEDWETNSAALTEASEALEKLSTQKSQLANRLQWLERCQDALPTLGELRAAETGLAALPSLPKLPENFADRVRDLRSQLADTARKARESGEALKRLREQAAEKKPDPKVLERAGEIQAIQAAIGAHSENENRLRKLETETERLRQTIDQSRADLGIDLPFERLHELRVTAPERALANTRGKAASETQRELRELTERARGIRRNIEALRRDAPAVDPARLRAFEEACERAERLRETASGLAARARAIARQETERATLCRTLGRDPAEFATIAALRPPSRATVDEFSDAFAKAKQALDGCNSRLEECRTDIRALRLEIEQRDRTHALPTPADLTDSRALRDHLATQLAESWKQTAPYDALLVAEHRKSNEEADLLADRLIRDAETVARIRENQNRLESLLAREKDIQRASEREQTALEKNRTAWAAACEHILPAPTSPAAMREWLDTHENFLRIHNQITHDAAELQDDAAAVEASTNRLRELCGAPADTNDFEALRPAAREILESLRKEKEDAAWRSGALESHKSELLELEPKLQAAQESAKEAAAAWEALLKPLGLSPVIEPASALILLDRRRELLRELETLNTNNANIDHLKESIFNYNNRASSTAKQCDIDNSGDAIVIESRLRTALNAALKENAALETLRESIVAAEEKLQIEDARKAELEADFRRELDRAKLEDADALDSFLATWHSAQSLRTEIDTARKQLSKLARGEEVERFIDRIGAEDAERLAGEQTALKEERGRIDQGLSETGKRVHDLEGKLAALERIGDDAARHEQLAHFEEERILEDSRRYIRLRTAIRLLRGQINRFREENQGPFMERAGHWFARLTGGAFAGLTPSYSDGDEPTIAGRRPAGEDRSAGGAEVPISGMSEGSRDQLYLALRLAGLELHLREHTPMPLILDDLLVHFDDARATHALRALAEMSKNCQVLLFTHHRHLVDLAAQTLAPDAFALNEIGGGGNR